MVTAHFDEHQFQNKRQLEEYPIHVRRLHDGSFQTTSIDYGDYRTMKTERHNAPGGGRRKPTPTWAHSKEKLQHLVVVHMERRAWLYNPDPKLSLTERLAIAEHRWNVYCRPRLIEIATKLSQEYVALKREGRDIQRQARLAIQIENLDGQLKIEQWPAIFLRVIYLYHATGLDSVAISSELGGLLRPPAIRQLVTRAGKIAEVLFAPGYVTPTRQAPKPPVERYCLICQTRVHSVHRLYCSACQRKPRPVRYCSLCGDEIATQARSYCGKTCRRRAEILYRHGRRSSRR